jgi:1,4-dihydroxy-2-naphthoate octaprenyltransferase
VTALGLLPADQVRKAALLAFGTSVLLGFYLAALGGWPIVLIGLLSLLAGYCYSLGPYPLSGSPFGEALVVAFFGVAAVSGTAFLHGLAPEGRVLLLGGVIGLPAAAVLLVNNHRDRVQDAATGRRTLAILIGERRARGLYAALLALACGGGWLLVRPCAAGTAVFAPAALLAALLISRMMAWPVSPRLNQLIAGTSLFQILLLAALAGSAALCAAGGHGHG